MTNALTDPFFVALKAGLCALLAVLGVEALGVPDKLSAGFVAVLCVSPSLYGGLRTGLEQLGGSLLGGLLALVLGLFVPREPSLFVALFATIWVCFRLGAGRAFVVAAFSVLYVLLVPLGTPTLTLEYRLASVGVGLFCGFGVNAVVSLLFHRRVYRRRLVLARRMVASHLRELGALLEAPPSEEEAEARRQDLFEPVFPTLRALLSELEDAVRESRLRGAAARSRMEAARREVQGLLEVTHHGKGICFALGRSPGTAPQAAAQARALAEAVEARALPPAALERPEPAFQSALADAREAWSRVLPLPSF